MFKKVLAVSILLCVALPAAAGAWTLNTWVKSAGGYMQSPNLAGNQTSVNGSVTRSYTTTTPLTVTVTPNPGYSISILSKNGLIQTLADPTAVYTTTALGPPNQSVQATFARTSYTLSASAGAGGTVSPASITPVYLGGQSPAKVFTYTPSSGYSVQSITVPGHVLNTDYQLLNAVTNLPITLPAATNVRVKVSIVNVKGSAALTGTFVIIGANAGPSQTVLTGAPVLLDGSASTGATTYAWTQVSGPATVTLSGANTSQATFTAPATLGSYVFRLTINGGSSSSTTTVYVTDNVTQAARSQCDNCHATQGVGTGVYANWSSSVHKAVPVMCYHCHVGANTAGHPGTITSGSVDGKTFNYIAGGANFCATCHAPTDPTIQAQFAASPHFAPAGAASCSWCHANPHNVNAACVNCHKPGNSYGLPWPPTGMSFHNAYTGTNLCSNCHLTHNPSVITGMTYPHFANSTTAAQYINPNISCDNCHVSAVDNSFNVYPANSQWAQSGKGNPTSPAYIAFQFKSKGTPSPATPANSVADDCVRCHTTTGYINYVSSAFTTIAPFGSASGSREMVACNACHNNITGFDTTFSRRIVGLETDPLNAPGLLNVKAWYNYSSADTKKFSIAKTFDNIDGNPLKDSNICIACHTGRAVGAVLKTIGTKVGNTGFFWRNVNFIDPHNMGAASIMFDVVRSGYEYRSSFTSPAHVDIQVLDSTQGPCVGCHMSAPQKHLFSAISTASNGVIQAITSPVCFTSTCHPSVGSMDTETLKSKKTGFEASKADLATFLAAKGIYFNPAMYPYFFTTTGEAPAPAQDYAHRTTDWYYDSTYQGVDLMGAAFNLRLLQSDSGAYVHSSVYIKKLLHDTIEYLNYGNVTGRDISGLLGSDARAYLYP